MELHEKILSESPNKKYIFNLINGKRSITEIWDKFNKIHRLKEKTVTKQYISQIIKELEQLDMIEVHRRGKEKIPSHSL